jgi:hypothetical protein
MSAVNVFMNNKYTRIYYSIIAQAKLRVNLDYTERHHIIPKSLGGDNTNDNLVRLTAKEHYVCHLLLVHMTQNESRTKMRYAVYRFIHRNQYQQERIKITGRRYQYLKEQMILANKERPGPNRGKVMSDEQKLKISQALKGRKLGPMSEEHKSKIGKYKRTPNLRKSISEMRKAQTGKQHRTDEQKVRMGAWQKGVPKPKVRCIHCNKETSTMNHTRWHGDNCKLSS